jgi:hypothetical protein
VCVTEKWFGRKEVLGIDKETWKDIARKRAKDQSGRMFLGSHIVADRFPSLLHFLKNHSKSHLRFQTRM